MRIKFIALFVLIGTVGFSDFLFANSEMSVKYKESKDYIDIILDETHAYVYLNYSRKNKSHPYSIYSSLMPKDEATHEGIEDFPKILQLLLKVSDFISESTTGVSLAEVNDATKNELNFTFRDLMDACRFGFSYVISDFFETAVEGTIVTDQPDSQKIKLRKRFYLTRAQANQAVALIDRLSKDSSEGKIIYDRLHHNCVDYVREIYEGIGLDKSQGAFLSQFGLEPNSPIFEDEENCEKSACMILKAYKIHNEGDIDFQKVLSVIWNVSKGVLGV
jgi:hypothetical protein